MHRVVEFNVRIGCPIRCGYCPQDKVLAYGYKDKVLSYENFCKILYNVIDGANSVDVIFSGHSEPMSIPHWYDLLEYANSRQQVRRVVLFSTGYKLNEHAITQLAGLNKLSAVWHLGDKDLMPGIDESFLDKVSLVLKLIPNSKFVCVGLEDTFNRIRSVIEPLGAKLNFDKVINRAGNLECVTDYSANKTISLGLVKKERSPVTCKYVNEFRRPVVMPDGTTLVCPNDYGSDLIIGNLITQSWDSLDYEKIINLQRKCPDVICKRGCHQAVRVPTNYYI